MAIVTGFWAAKTLATAHELRLFDWLSDTAGKTIQECSSHYRMEERPAEMLLTACAALGLLERDDERYRNSPMSERHLVRGRPLYFGGWIEMADRREYPAWMHLKDALQSNRPLTWNPSRQASLFDGEDPLLVATFWEAMYALSITTSWALAEAVDLSGVKKLLDVGGGGAAHDITLCRRYPQLQTTVYDLGFVCELTRHKIEQAGLADRIGLIDGDFLKDDKMPSGYDAILLSKILLDWTPAQCALIIAKCYAALPSGGRIIISDLFVADTKDGPIDAALMSLNMLVETWGRNYTSAEYAAWLTDAGCVDIKVIHFDAPAANGAVVGYKP
ncbi:methyltransferase [Dyella caseinilytica]|uniref:Methyltransferase n=2 Tax=Dyella caseinilytica TaxID=1849581 RepID=A0ABX7GYX7_9GAMM|nr:methyltransferase [Dyella caseinilytica]